MDERLKLKYKIYGTCLIVAVILLLFWTIDTINYSNFRKAQLSASVKIVDECSAKGVPTTMENGKTQYNWTFDEKACRSAIESGESSHIKTISCKYEYSNGYHYGVATLEKNYRNDEYYDHGRSLSELALDGCLNDIEYAIMDQYKSAEDQNRH